MSRIQVLPQAIVDRIAAGEVLVSQVNAIKELVENSLDAGSTRVHICYTDASLLSFEVLDNGSGIHASDLPLLATRFATSKLKNAKDLTQGRVMSFGFRGEALASVSQSGSLTVRSRTDALSTCSVAHYAGSEMISHELIPCDHVPEIVNHGTQIIVEDLFHNNPIKRRSMTPSKVFADTVDLVKAFAVEYPSCEFLVARNDRPTDTVVLAACESRRERIEQVTRVKASSILTEHEEYVIDGMLSCDVWIDPLEKSVMSLRPVILNGRVVEFASLRRSLARVFRESFSGPHRNIWYGVSLSVEPQLVDINAHPTKADVILANETGVISAVVGLVSKLLSSLRVTEPVKLHVIPSSPAMPGSMRRISTTRALSGGDSGATVNALLPFEVAKSISSVVKERSIPLSQMTLKDVKENRMLPSSLSQVESTSAYSTQQSQTQTELQLIPMQERVTKSEEPIKEESREAVLSWLSKLSPIGLNNVRDSSDDVMYMQYSGSIWSVSLTSLVAQSGLWSSSNGSTSVDFLLSDCMRAAESYIPSMKGEFESLDARLLSSVIQFSDADISPSVRVLSIPEPMSLEVSELSVGLLLGLLLSGTPPTLAVGTWRVWNLHILDGMSYSDIWATFANNMRSFVRSGTHVFARDLPDVESLVDRMVLEGGMVKVTSIAELYKDFERC